MRSASRLMPHMCSGVAPGSEGPHVRCLIGRSAIVAIFQVRGAARGIVTSCGDVVDERRILSEQLVDRGGAESKGLTHRRVAASGVHGARPRVVRLVLFTEDNLACTVALHPPTVDTSANSVCIGVEAFGISLPLRSILLSHPLGVRVVRNPDAIGAVELLPHLLGGARTVNPRGVWSLGRARVRGCALACAAMSRVMSAVVSSSDRWH